MHRTKDAVEILEHIAGDDPVVRSAMSEEEVNLDIAQMVYDARTEADLTQTQLARRIGTTQSVISRLEDADYRGHSLAMLHRIARRWGNGSRSASLARPRSATRRSDQLSFRSILTRPSSIRIDPTAGLLPLRSP